jgi:hypothetical protein
VLKQESAVRPRLFLGYATVAPETIINDVQERFGDTGSFGAGVNDAGW